MRGKVFFFDPEHLRIGITPAYAGKSDLMGGFKMAQEDHPRLCGEKKWFMTKKTFMAGSPPPMRGKVIFMMHTSAFSRITPAYAGKRDQTAVIFPC